MKKVKIVKKIINKQPLFISPSWVTNGIWLIKKELIENEVFFDSAAHAETAFKCIASEKEDSYLEKSSIVMEGTPFTLFLKTDWLQEAIDDPKILKRKFQSREGKEVFINELYVKAFDISEVYQGDGKLNLLNDPKNPSMVFAGMKSNNEINTTKTNTDR